MTFCACGKPLHYRDREVRKMVQKLVDELGPDVRVTVSGRSYTVQRHYIALHGLAGDRLEILTMEGVVRRAETADGI